MEKINTENYIEAQYRELKEKGINIEFLDLYKSVEHGKLREVMATLHYYLISLFRTMNRRLPTGEFGAHFWAEPSRELLNVIEITVGLHDVLKESKYAFEIDSYYFDLINECREFLSSNGGSTLPANMRKINLYYLQPIFKMSKNVIVKKESKDIVYNIKLIGEGSYANVYKYKDDFYDRSFVIKRAKKNLSDKELLRFKREYEEMKELSSPYILEVYRYDKDKHEYITEYMDYTLDAFITKNNSNLSNTQRKCIAQQILRAFSYIHSKKRLHRDISPKNILIKEYEDVLVIKISDFGLVKIPGSELTTVNTEFKGYFNDPELVVEGFDTYNILHETYALTRILYYIMTGRTNIERINNEKLKKFVEKGLNSDKSKRFQSVAEMIIAFREI